MQTACIRMHFHFKQLKVPDADTLHFTHFKMVANSFYDSKFTAKYGDGSTVLLIEDD